MAPKPGGPPSPKGKSGARSSALGAAGATVLGGSTSPKGPAGAGVNGKASGLSVGGGKNESNAKSTSSAPLGKAGSAAVGGDAAAASKAAGAAKAPPAKAAPSEPAKAAPSEPAKAASPEPAKAASPEPAKAAPSEPAKAASSESAKGNGEVAKAKAAPDVPNPAVGTTDPEAVMKFHSAVRWEKPWAEIEEAASGVDLKTICAEKDPKNGNTVMHIASQNGHLDILTKLIKAGGPVNVKNGKGQTPLHMSIEYDFYFVSKLLFDSGADGEIANEDGNRAIDGIDGGKTGPEAWDNPVTILRAANTAEELDFAFKELEKALANPEIVSKEQLIKAGLTKKKSPVSQDIWDHKRFMSLAAKF